MEVSYQCRVYSQVRQLPLVSSWLVGGEFMAVQTILGLFSPSFLLDFVKKVGTDRHCQN